MISIILHHLYGPDIYNRVICPFLLMGFFFVSGYTFSTKYNFRCFLSSKVKTLIVPIFCFGLINTVLACIVKGDPFFLRMLSILRQKPGAWDDLWFIACLFVMEIIFYFILRITSSFFKQFLICILLLIIGYISVTNIQIIIPWHLENACMFVIFMYFGYFIKRSETGRNIMMFMQSSVKWCLLLLATILYSVVIFSVNNYPVDVHVHNYGIFPIFMLSAILGVGLVFVLTVILEHYAAKINLSWLQYIGANTLVYYAFQSKVISFFIFLGGRLGFSAQTYVGNIVYCILVCALLAIPTYLVKRYTPFMLGKRII